MVERHYDAQSRIRDILANPDASQVFLDAFPGFLDSEWATQLQPAPLAFLLSSEDMAPDRRQQLLAELGRLENPAPAPSTAPRPEVRDDYEPVTVERGSATLSVPAAADVWGMCEIAVAGPSHGNPFVDVDLNVTFTSPSSRSVVVGGFYDDDGRYLARLLPDEAGRWTFTTRCNAKSMDGITGTIDVGTSDRPGPVRVADTFHFAYASGERYTPFGTTAYAWIHQPSQLQVQTLGTLSHTGFNKIRMCVFPKSFVYNTDEPELYPFRERDGSEDRPREGVARWDTERFDVRFFRALERRIDDLDRLGIQADLILFHPYDRWGFANLGPVADDRYVTYLVRRLAAYPNVWWALANEYDLVFAKTLDDWERIAATIRTNDPVGHLMSIHNCVTIFDHSRPWVTHASVQRTDPWRTTENVDRWRRDWGKPVVVDECAYEGDLEFAWGNISAQELVRRCWEGTIRGGYVQHGETYHSDDEVVWWAKGGRLHGDSEQRIRFLAELVAQTPHGCIDPLMHPGSDVTVGGEAGVHEIHYFGLNRPRSRTLRLASDHHHHVDVIDTWNMTVERLPGEFSGEVQVRLPAREYMALRVTRL